MKRFRRGDKVRVVAFSGVVINSTSDGGYRVSIKQPVVGKEAYWTVVPESMVLANDKG